MPVKIYMRIFLADMMITNKNITTTDEPNFINGSSISVNISYLKQKNGSNSAPSLGTAMQIQTQSHIRQAYNTPLFYFSLPI